MDNKDILQILKFFSELNIEEMNFKSEKFELSLKKSKYFNIPDYQKNNNILNNILTGNFKNLDILTNNEIDQLLSALGKKNINVYKNLKNENDLNFSEKKSNTDTNNNKDNNEKNIKIVTSPIVGTFYEAPAPGKPPFVKVGDKVSKGQVLCIIEAMKVMNKIESEIEGEIVEKLVKNEQPVEFGTPLFKIKV